MLTAISLDIEGTSADKSKAKTLDLGSVYKQLNPKPTHVFIYKMTDPKGMKELPIDNKGVVALGEYSLADFFTANIIGFARKSVSGSSGGGCSTGSVAPAFLLLLAPLAILLKK